jgi:hypothetical protein
VQAGGGGKGQESFSTPRKGATTIGNKKAKLARDDAPAAKRLQSSIEKSIAGVATNNAAREEKYDARCTMIFEKQGVKIGLLKTNVAAIKRKEYLALLTADTSSMCAEVKAWHKARSATSSWPR